MRGADHRGILLGEPVMARRLPSLVACLAAFAPSGAVAQSAADYLPPSVQPAPAPQVEPPEPARPVVPVAAAAGEAGFVLRGIDVEGASAVPAAALAPVWADLVGQPVTLATLAAVADGIGAAYRARGFLLSQAYLPDQTIADGVVRVVVIEGFVDAVAIDGGRGNQQAMAARLFAPVAGDRPLRLTTLERSVLLARDTLGGTVETTLVPSAGTFGAADLTVALVPDPVTGFGAIDNRGSRLYGAWMLTGGGSGFDLLGLNERIDALVSVAPRDLSLAYGQLAVEVPVPALAGTWLDGGRVELLADTSHGKPDLERSGSPDGLTATTDETNLSAGLAVPFVRTRSQNLTARVGLDWQSSESVTGFFGTELPSRDRLLVVRAEASWDLADRFGGVTLVDAGLRQGLAGGSDIEATGPAAGDPGFTLATLTLSRLQRLGTGRWALHAEAIGQLASTVLPNSERFALGNSSIGRGFAPGNTTGDSGWGARLELRRTFGSAGGVEATEVYAFGDYGRAYDRASGRDGMTMEPLGSAGIGARVDVRPWLTLTPEIARQLDGVATDTTDPNHETRFYIGATARF